ncbi:MAG: hypothetical protein IT388_11050 [Nitrospirales bacterium]|nr:hypothetical protein [Nitrospirales bacterium]
MGGIVDGVRKGEGKKTKGFRLAVILLLGIACSLLNASASPAEDLKEWLPAKPMPDWLLLYSNADKPGSHPSAALIGLIQGGFVDSSNSPSQFKIFKFRPGIVGTITDYLSFYTLVEFASNAVTSPTSGGGRLLDATVTLSLKPVRLQLGQTVMPFATDATPAGAVPWIDYADAVKNIYLKTLSTDTGTTAGRDLGLMAWQVFRKGNASYTYFVSVTNGNGLSQNDTNDSKDVMVHLKAAYGSLYAGGAYWTGKTSVSGKDLDKDKYNVHAGFGDYTPASKDRIWGLVEYLRTNEEQSAGGELTADGWQAALGVRPIKDVMAIYRYSRYETEPVTGTGNKITMHSLIGQYFVPNGKGSRLMVQYDFRDNRLTPSDEKAFYVQVSVPFAVSLFGGK